MSIYLEPRNIIADLEDFKSVLIVSCPICPQISLAMQQKTPLFNFFKYGLKVPAFEDYIRSIRGSLEERGIRTGLYTGFMPSPLMCLWTEGQRQDLVKHARGYDAVLVLGCHSATYTVEEALKGTDCKVLQGMRMKGLTNATMKFEFPLQVNLEMHSLKKEDKRRRSEVPTTAASETEEEAT